MNGIVTPVRSMIGGSALLLLAACGGEPNDVSDRPLSRGDADRRFGGEAALGTDGSSITEIVRNPTAQGQTAAGVRVNRYMWQGALDTLSFLPLETTDPFSGVIVTDWGAFANTPGERFKVTVFVNDVALDVNSLRVAVFREVQQGEAWVSAPVDATVPRRIEDAILTRARQIRIAEQEGTPLTPA